MKSGDESESDVTPREKPGTEPTQIGPGESLRTSVAAEPVAPMDLNAIVEKFLGFKPDSFQDLLQGLFLKMQEEDAKARTREIADAQFREWVQAKLEDMELGLKAVHHNLLVLADRVAPGMPRKPVEEAAKLRSAREHQEAIGG